MAETSRFWDGTSVGDATISPYDAATEFAQVMMALAFTGRAANKGGVFKDDLLSLLPSSPSANTLRLISGRALVYGSWYESTANVDTTIPTPSTSTRIDRIVLRKSWAGQNVRITRITGTEGVTTPPALVQVIGTTWDVPICYVSITTGAVITITDERVFVSDMAAVDARNNLLVNGGFEIAQRGTGAFTVGGAYSLDRWRVSGYAPSTFSMSQITSTIGSNGFSAQVVYTHGGAGKINWCQKIEDYLQLRGKSVTFSVRMKSTVTGTVKLELLKESDTPFATPAVGSYNVGTGEQTLSVTGVVPAAATSLYVCITMDVATATAEFNDAMLVIGSVAADYAPLTPADDLARCLRYYEVNGGINSAPRVDGYNVAGGVTTAGVVYGVKKSVAPTVTKNGTWGVQNCAQPILSGVSKDGYSIYTTATATGAFNCYPGSTGDTITSEANP